MSSEGHRVLIVDDDAEICELISGLLEQEGFAPSVAYDGKTAMQKVRLECRDVVLLDLKLPDLDGLELLRQMKALDEDLPVVIITGSGEIPKAVEAMRAGAHDFLSKPFEGHELIRITHRALVERQLKLKLKRLAHQINVNEKLTEIMGPSDAIGR